MEDWAEIRRLHRAEKMPIKAIVRHLGVSRNTVRGALRSNAPPRYERAPKGSIVDVVEREIGELLQQFPAVPATVIAERIGWESSIRVLRDRVAELRPLFLPPDPAQRTFYRPGELGQFDLWQPDVEIPVGHDQAAKLWVVVGALGFSRFSGGWMVPSRAAHDVLGGHLEVLGQFGAVPRRLVWDQEGRLRDRGLGLANDRADEHLARLLAGNDERVALSDRAARSDQRDVSPLATLNRPQDPDRIRVGRRSPVGQRAMESDRSLGEWPGQ